MTAKIVSLSGYRRGSKRLGALSDEELLARIASGDDQALAELYQRLGSVAYALAHRILRNDALAQDAVQEAFLAVWRAAGGYLAERSKPSTWVLTLVHRRAVDIVRREEHRRTDSLDPEHELVETTDAGDTVVRRRIVREALRQLPADQRETIELAYYGGYTQSELAERLDQPLGTIKSRMFAGMSRLRDLLASEAVGEASHT